MVYSMNDMYPQFNKVATTTAETIPEDAEKSYYTDSTVVNSEGKTEIVDKKSIFITIGVVIGILFLLNEI